MWTAALEINVSSRSMRRIAIHRLKQLTVVAAPKKCYISSTFPPVGRGHPRALAPIPCTLIPAFSNHHKRPGLSGCGGNSELVNIRFIDLSFDGRRQYFSSRSSSRAGSSRFQLDALPFSISPEEALDAFRKWAEDDQGLRYLMSYNSVRIGAAYAPVWSFDVNVRFAVTSSSPTAGRKERSFNWKPQMFSAYGNQSIVHIPGISAYAGYSYRRSLINPVHTTTLVFMGHRTERLGSWMLQDLVLQSTGATIPVVPDAWNATKGRSFTIVRDDLYTIAELEFEAEKANNAAWASDSQLDVQTEVIASRRVMMPTYIIDYSILGLEYRAYVSGCDEGAAVSGVSHRLLGDITVGGGGSSGDQQFHRTSQDFVSQMIAQSSNLLRVTNLPFIMRLLRPVLSVAVVVLTRIFTMIPVLGVAGGIFAGFRKIIQPWMSHRSATAEWERQREHEALMAETGHHKDTRDEFRMNDFTDSAGAAKAYFSRHRESILRHLSGDQAHHEGSYDWYKDWQEWARQQWNQQQQQQQQQTYQQQQQFQQQRTRTARQQPKKPEFHWDFDPNDPYSVLGIRRGATKAQVSEAFRKEMLKHHPDTQPNASEAQKLRAVERSKLITDAYRKIKAEMKR